MTTPAPTTPRLVGRDGRDVDPADIGWVLDADRRARAAVEIPRALAAAARLYWVVTA